MLRCAWTQGGDRCRAADRVTEAHPNRQADDEDLANARVQVIHPSVDHVRARPTIATSPANVPNDHAVVRRGVRDRHKRTDREVARDQVRLRRPKGRPSPAREREMVVLEGRPLTIMPSQMDTKMEKIEKKKITVY
jgi:hypothetical protein